MKQPTQEPDTQAILLEALENLCDCPGLTWLNGYRDELDAAMIAARAAIEKARQSHVPEHLRGFEWPSGPNIHGRDYPE
tara:strand:- start:15914 stop:16150 length:237 start_codon:yes stop_codon:yes gene_type:complete